MVISTYFNLSKASKWQIAHPFRIKYFYFRFIKSEELLNYWTSLGFEEGDELLRLLFLQEENISLVKLSNFIVEEITSYRQIKM